MTVYSPKSRPTPSQTVDGKQTSNPLMAVVLPKSKIIQQNWRNCSKLLQPSAKQGKIHCLSLQQLDDFTNAVTIHINCSKHESYYCSKSLFIIVHVFTKIPLPSSINKKRQQLLRGFNFQKKNFTLQSREPLVICKLSL